MIWVPGWDTIQSANRWSNFYFWVSIASLIGLGISEVASHRYSERKDELVAIEEQNTKRTHDDEIARIRLEAATLSDKAEILRAKNLEVEAAVAPRILEQGLTSASLKKFAGTLFVVVSLPDFESKRAAGQIRAMLSMAGWKRFTASIGPQHYPFFDGVVVHVLGDGAKADPAVNALVNILETSKITARSGYPMWKMGDDGMPDTQSMMDRSGPTVIIVEVGPKPLPTSMQLKPEDVPTDARGNKIWGNIEE